MTVKAEKFYTMEQAAAIFGISKNGLLRRVQRYGLPRIRQYDVVGKYGFYAEQLGVLSEHFQKYPPQEKYQTAGATRRHKLRPKGAAENRTGKEIVQAMSELEQIEARVATETLRYEPPPTPTLDEIPVIEISRRGKVLRAVDLQWYYQYLRPPVRNAAEWFTYWHRRLELQADRDFFRKRTGATDRATWSQVTYLTIKGALKLLRRHPLDRFGNKEGVAALVKRLRAIDRGEIGPTPSTSPVDEIAAMPTTEVAAIEVSKALEQIGALHVEAMQVLTGIAVAMAESRRSSATIEERLDLLGKGVSKMVAEHLALREWIGRVVAEMTAVRSDLQEIRKLWQ